MINFPTRIPDCDSDSPTILDFFLSSEWLSLEWEILIMLFGLCDHLRDVPWEDIFKLSASAAASEFCECVQVGIDVYIPHRKY